MRYLIQFLVPALIFAGVVYLLTRNRRQEPSQDGVEPRSDTLPFIVILVVSGVVALGSAWLLTSIWEP